MLSPLHVGELVIDGGTLGHILGTEAEQELAAVGAQCGSVVICRSSPSQKAAVVRMMAEYEMRQVCLLLFNIPPSYFCPLKVYSGLLRDLRDDRQSTVSL